MLQRALASVYRQTVLPDKICLVIDEPENREKYEFLGRYDERLAVEFTGGGFGGAGARNVGLDNAKGDYVFFLDDDDEWLPEKIQMQIAILSAHPDVVGVTCWNYHVSGKKTSVVQRDRGEINTNLGCRNTIGSFSFFGFRFSGDCAGVRLDASLKASQDWDFYLRLREHGSFSVVEKPLVRYAAHEGPRISGDPERKVRAWRKVLENHRRDFTKLERLQQKARVHMVEITRSRNGFRAFHHLLSACFLALVGFRKGCSWRIVGRATRNWTWRYFN